ncbi:amidohydrolase family protein [Pseudoflavitalea sp. G-6-1-2]|uniref:metal-dependent hydrolase family protein n=1 Tax=Pseudoflavitalea sp. G-6-1-2 TaxID=2728841 RepID=UPI00146C356E|nr:amidohydrolase family protein [Pseudoflavitalea sp. G-6-1-2]NML23259.1 amidohydrolase family protein [Pseudoflavitalea sp. G-6-1-2]
MKRNLLLSLCIIASIGLQAQSTILINNVQIFDGVHEKLFTGNVLIQKDSIAKVSASPIPTNKSADTRIIDGKGKYLIPGLIDAHWHSMMCAVPQMVLLTADVGYLNLVAAGEAKNTLMRGFTSVRDLAGPSFGLKLAIDQGLVLGPRIYPSGSMISQTGGHGDFRLPYETPAAANAPLSHGEAIGGGAIADGPAAVQQKAREQLMKGATQLKLAAGGGVSSSYDPIDVSQYSEAEFKAAVDAAENWGTYVTVHAYTPRAIQTALRAGVKCIDHAQLMDDATAKMIAEKGAWLCLQPFLDNEYSNQQTGENREKQKMVQEGTDRAYQLAKKYKIKTGWGTDILFNPSATKNQGAILTTLTRWYTPFEILKTATSTNGELLAFCGQRNPYPKPLGVIREGAYADLILVDGNPLENIKLVADPDKNFLLIMKNGKVYKEIIEK